MIQILWSKNNLRNHETLLIDHWIVGQSFKFKFDISIIFTAYYMHITAQYFIRSSVSMSFENEKSKRQKCFLYNPWKFQKIRSDSTIYSIPHNLFCLNIVNEERKCRSYALVFFLFSKSSHNSLFRWFFLIHFETEMKLSKLKFAKSWSPTTYHVDCWTVIDYYSQEARSNWYLIRFDLLS